ncbi:hypothetical protein CEJ86_23215 [Sinorhizobium meliloti]|uniref:Hemerythrin-like domain-containing protein n=1 Tax=Rhizobium meliloti TaxID=382 RepID=A0A2J0YXM9_RHIML|nr:hypothetical protein CEJ86_23215 [Sinorhizobium meliloti]
MAISSPLHRLEAKYGELLALCDAVESIIDSLGGPMDRDLCIATAAKIRSLSLGQTSNEPQPSPFDVRTTRAGRAVALDGSHVADTLRSAASDRCAVSWETVALMLHAFLEGLRHHVAAEQAIIAAIKRSNTAH